MKQPEPGKIDDAFKKGIDDLVVIGLTKRTWDDSIIGQNYKALQESVSATIYGGGPTPETDPLFTSTFGLARVFLKGPPARK